MDVAVGDDLLGRVIDPLGRPLDGHAAVASSERLPIERPAPPIMDRAPVRVPLQSGLKVVDALIPIGRGQRELIVGDRGTGKTSIAIDTIVNQRGKNVLCIYCAIGQRAAAVARVVANLREHGAMEYTVVVVAEGKVRAQSVKRVKSQGQSTWLRITLAEGKNREIRRMLAKLGHKVMRLRRITIGSVQLDRLPKGKSRKLSLKEIETLKRLAQKRTTTKPTS